MTDISNGAPAEIAVDEAIASVASGTWLLDVREQNEWDEGHAELAHLVPLSALQEHLDEIPRDEPVLVICHSGYRSMRAANALRAAGYDATSIAGGMVAWQSAGGVVVTDAAPSASA